MCIMTNKKVEELLKGMRAVEKDSSVINNEDLVDTIANLKTLSDDVIRVFKLAKKEFVKRGVTKTFYLKESGQKVYLGDGKKTTTFYIDNIYRDVALEVLSDLQEFIKTGSSIEDAFIMAQKNEVLEQFLNAINLVQGKIGELSDLDDIVSKHKKVEPGKVHSTVKVSKMTKDELVEAETR